MTGIGPHTMAARHRAFTLVESLLVMAVMVILAALAVTAVQSYREDLYLARAGQLLVDEIGQARQMASARNWTIYLYLYKVPDAAPNGYSAVQLWRISAPVAGGDGTTRMIPVDRAYFLPTQVVISEDATRLSPLLAAMADRAAPAPPLTGLPPTLVGTHYVALAITPSGALALDNPPAGSNGIPPSAASVMAGCCLTVVPARFGAQKQTLANFATVQINPYAGTPTIYRP